MGVEKGPFDRTYERSKKEILQASWKNHDCIIHGDGIEKWSQTQQSQERASRKKNSMIRKKRRGTLLRGRGRGR